MQAAEKVKGTFWIQQTGNAKLSFCKCKGVLQILPVAPPPHHVHVHQVWPYGVHHRLEGDTIAPTGTKVLHLNSMIPEKHNFANSYERQNMALIPVTAVL